MNPRLGVAALLLVVAAVAVPSADAARSGSPLQRPPQDRPAQHPVASDPVELDAGTVRDELFDELRAAGGVTEVVTRGERVTTVEVRPEGSWDVIWQRFSWHEDGSTREVLALPDDRLCVNLAEGQALQGRGDQLYSDGQDDWITGTIQASDRPFSCTTDGADLGRGRYVTQDLLSVDPLRRLGALGGLTEELHCTDLGTETEPGGTTTRHLRFTFPGASSAGVWLTSRIDVWVDPDSRIVRARANDLDGGPAIRATFSYADIPAVAIPDDHGVLAFTPTPPATEVTATDGVGDVDAPRPKDPFVPSIDITSVRVTFDAAARRVVFRFGFADLVRIKAGYVEGIGIGGGGRNLHFDRRRGASAIYVTTVPGHPHYGAVNTPCRKATSVVRPDLDVAVLSVPLRCAVAPDHEPARFAIGVYGQRARTHLGWDHAVTGQPLLTE